MTNRLMMAGIHTYMTYNMLVADSDWVSALAT